ncbi:hypothetical protein TTHERM_00574290 (macronuclear) [Tetrahymena thermophila SB210]|uniref:Kinase domain protein n=1 Tax=Tetrahymena thermophila (strain SB210) TaxID=312017 RepID=Q22V72_TETTS|nr:hypothetical protein TTHERM_00574290 [Tetrahymena thermophila SB210]EAR89076.3 hypothetical protein TTHERM_00574290 [Tetrahymena thermophila SB210]|eukprot:XP_001009321.3 hypothetical protein TTHERM_00574290 [Tetrahymena thermophila SB210]
MSYFTSQIMKNKSKSCLFDYYGIRNFFIFLSQNNWYYSNFEYLCSFKKGVIIKAINLISQNQFGIILILTNEDLPAQITQDKIIRTYQIPLNDDIFYTALEFKLDKDLDDQFKFYDLLSINEDFQKIRYAQVLARKKKLIEPEIVQLSTKISQCIQLLQLNVDLFDNPITPSFASILVQSISQCQEIQELVLDLGWCNLGNTEIKWIENLANCKNMTTLHINLESNNINQGDIKIIGTALENLNKLDNLYLGLQYNNIKEQGFNSLVRSISKLKNLQSLNLDLYKNNIENDEKIEFEIQQCNLLTNLTLNLSQNCIQYEGAKSLGSAIQSFDKLKKLNIFLVNCQVREGINYIAQGVSNCKNLQSLNLDLKMNNIESQEQEVINTIANQKKLFYLNLNLCQNQFLDSKFLVSFLNQLGTCSSLKDVKFDFNSCAIDCLGLKALGKSISLCENLQSVDLNIEQNYIFEKGILDFLQEISQCQKLFKLALIQKYSEVLEMRKLEQPEKLGIFIKNIAEQFQEIVKQLKQCKKLNTLEFNFVQNQTNMEKVMQIQSNAKDQFNITNINNIYNIHKNEIKYVNNALTIQFTQTKQYLANQDFFSKSLQ